MIGAFYASQSCRMMGVLPGRAVGARAAVQPWRPAVLLLLLAMLCMLQFKPAGAIGIEPACLANYYTEVKDILFDNDTVRLTRQQKEDLEVYLSAVFMPCAMKKDIMVDKAVTIVLPDEPFIDIVRNVTWYWERLTAVSVRYDVVPALEIVQEALDDLKQEIPVLVHSGYLLPGASLGSIAALGGTVDLTTKVVMDHLLTWNNILGFFRTQAAVYDGKVSCVPMDGDMLLLYYRKDILAKRGLRVPDTWDQLLQVATQLNGTDMDGDKKGDFGVCMPKHECFMAYWPFLFAAPYLQYNGTTQGGFFDPATATPLTNNSAFVAAMKVYKAVMQLSPSGYETKCETSSKLFNKGRCLFTVMWGDQFKMSQKGEGSVVRGKVGVAMTPGSTQVWDRNNKVMTPCTSSLCPYAQPLMKNGTPTFVNRAPYSARGGWCFTVDKAAGQQAQEDAYYLASYLASPQVSMQLVLDVDSGIDPFRVEHLDVGKWTAAGYDYDDTTEFLEAVQTSVNNPNVLLQLRLPMNTRTLPIITTETARYLKDEHVSAEEMAHSLSQALALIMSSNPSSLDSYQKGIGWRPQLASAPTPAQQKRQTLANKMISIAVLLTIGLLLLLILVVVLLGVYIMRRNGKHRTLFGNIRPPAAAPESSLVVTDIQGSTSLWELLPSEVMDRALELHHQTVRSCLVKHGGYESATEGDSFILAFHSPQDAVLFSIDLQLQLLEVDWPQQLLECPCCKPVYARPRGMVASALLDCPGDSDAPFGLQGGGLKKGRRMSLFKTSLPAEMLLTSSTTGLDEPSSNEAKRTFASVMKNSWLLEEDDLDEADTEPQGTLCYRGLRVRVGIHSGIDGSCLVSNNGANRMQYGGEALARAKKISDVGGGGAVVMSGTSYRLLSVEPLTQKLLLMQCGTHCLDCPGDPHTLYMLLPRCLVGRLAVLPPLSTHKQLCNGALEAPTGRVTIVFVYVVGAQALTQWDPKVAAHSLAMLQTLTNSLLQEHDGYCVEAADNLLLMAFHSSSSALMCCLDLHKQALLLNWPEKLLTNDLAEVMTVGSSQREAHAATQELVLRGLRLKMGLDMGDALSAPHSVTGRMAYRGKVMNRAARIASMASAGEVLCSGGVWGALSSDVRSMVEGVTLGEVPLKGVSQPQHIMQCRLRHGRACMESTQRISLITDPSAELAWPDVEAESSQDLQDVTISFDQDR